MLLNDIHTVLKIHSIFLQRLPQAAQDIQQRKILYMGLYLLIWGEAANIRFMPECLCYIFHNVSNTFRHVYLFEADVMGQ